MARREQASPSGDAVLGDRLRWQSAQRDDQQVAQALYRGAEVDALHELSEAGLLDGFFAFLEEVGVLGLFGELTLPGVQRVLVPVVQFVLLYLLKVLYGVPSMNALPALVFSNEAAMTLVGFNAAQIAQGLTQRGEAQRRHKRKQGPRHRSGPRARAGGGNGHARNQAASQPLDRRELAEPGYKAPSRPVTQTQIRSKRTRTIVAADVAADANETPALRRLLNDKS